MDTVTLVAEQIDDGQRLLDQLRSEGFTVRVACWIKPYDEDRWSLYLASPVVDQEGAAKGYADVLQCLRSLGKVWITGSDIKLIGEKHSLVQEILDLQQRFPGSTSMRPSLALPGGIPVEDIYLYRLDREKIKLYGLVYSGEPSGALHLSFEPHNPNSRLEVESQGSKQTYRAETGIDWVVAAPAGSILERNESGLMRLAWTLHGKRRWSSANTVWSLANLGLHGFSFLEQPGGLETG